MLKPQVGKVYRQKRTSIGFSLIVNRNTKIYPRFIPVDEVILCIDVREHNMFDIEPYTVYYCDFLYNNKSYVGSLQKNCWENDYEEVK